MGKHAEWRKIAKKARRKRIRQFNAKYKYEREEEERRKCEQSPSYVEYLQKQEEDESFQEQEETRLRIEAEQRWLQIEEEAQNQWRQLQKKLSEAREERARQNALIRLEWEHEQKRLQQLKEAKEREREELERQQQLLIERIEQFITYGGETPEHLKVNTEMNPNKPICPFFRKTAACRFRDSCSRNHIKPGVSRILLIPNFYSHYSLEQTETEYDDSSLEFETHETYSHFKEFFFDVLPEMEQYGKVRQFKVCCNHESHLRGNVYTEYSSTREAVKSFRIFNGRWYGGKQLSVEFCKIESWKSAICGLFNKNRCPKGSACNFLHVFQNPNNLFHHADKDKHRTPPRSSDDDEYETRNWRWSQSPERLPLDSSTRKKYNGHRRHVKNGRSVREPSRRSHKRKRSRSRTGSTHKSRNKKCDKKY